jgi:hypothetical protein
MVIVRRAIGCAFVIGFIDPVPEDREFELNKRQKAVNKWMIIDEVRELDGLEPLPDGLGAVIYYPTTNQPLGTPPGRTSAAGCRSRQQARTRRQAGGREELGKLKLDKGDEYEGRVVTG